MASILNVFEPKTKILSAEVNENFELVQSDVAEMGRALNSYVESELASLQSNLSSAQATLQNNINTVASDLSSFKTNIYDNIAPNYAALYSISSGFTAPSAGWCYFRGNQDHTSTVEVGGKTFEVSYDSGDGQSRGSLCLFVGKGTTATSFTNIGVARFIPCKGN